MNSTNSPPFDHERIDAGKGMLVEQTASEEPKSKGHRRVVLLASLIVTAVLVLTGGAALALSGGLPSVVAAASPSTPTPASPLHTPIPTDTPAPPSSSPAAPEVDRLNGFDLDGVYQACAAVVPTDVWGTRPPQSPERRQPDSFGIAGADPYTADHTNGDPNAIAINVVYQPDGGSGFSALCVASGDTTDPTVEYIRTLD